VRARCVDTHRGLHTDRAQPAAAAPDSGRAPIVTTAFSYTGEVVGDAAGGARRGATYAGAAAAQITEALRRIVGWSGLELFAFVLGTHGGAPSDRVGDVQGVSNLQAPETLRLEELWLQQNLFGNRLSVLAGRYDLNSEFYRLQSGGVFVNSSFGIGPELAQSGAAGPSIFPNTSVGARLALKPSPNAVLRVAMLDGVPVDRAHGSARVFAPGDGALLSSVRQPSSNVRIPRRRRTIPAFASGAASRDRTPERSPSARGTIRLAFPISPTRSRRERPCSIAEAAARTSSLIASSGRRTTEARLR
jgi:hypothetical protein